MRDSMSNKDKQLVEEWLKNNEITVCHPNDRTDPEEMVYTWGNRKKKKPAATKAKPDAK